MLIIDNLCLSVEDRNLRVLFAPFGNVVWAQVARTRMGESLRFGCVEMEKGEQASLARTALDGAMFKSFTLNIKDASHDGLTTTSVIPPDITQNVMSAS
jgi:RNA recognition motif-containing protein